jgi:hypothetical protein
MITVAPDLSSVNEIKFIDGDVVLLMAGEEKSLPLLAKTNNDETYEISSPAMGTNLTPADPSIVEVTSEGKLRALKDGETTVTAVNGDLQATINVVVVRNVASGTPVNPANPGNPGTPDNTVNPENPNNPVSPDDPDNSVSPDNPDNPVSPDDPDNPVNPDDPDNSVDPDDPGTPIVPANPDDPNNPDNPNNPNGKQGGGGCNASALGFGALVFVGLILKKKSAILANNANK